MIQFNKSYKSDHERQQRFNIFSNNMEEARRLQQEELGTAQYGITKFSDLTDDEFNTDQKEMFMSPSFDNITTEAKFPASCDWRKMGVISEVKDQGKKCKSSWAFAVVGNIEALWGIIGYPRNLSVQQIIDCNRCGDGCIRGYQWYAFRTVLEQAGLTNDATYKYKGKKDACNKNAKAEGWISGFQMLPRNERAMASHLAHKGTLTVAINKSPLKFYQRGVIHQPNCDQALVHHVALIVGYAKGKKKTGPYWILKNSWGKNWGENGYFRMYRGKNMGGITMYPLTATLDMKVKIKCPV
ncbi:cathepsin W-like [Pelodytes ibericus]